MKKVILSAAILVAGVLSASAQKEAADSKDLKFSVGIDAGIPVGDIKPYSSLAIGGDLQGEYTVASTVGLTLSAGYLKYTAKSGFESNGGLIPVLVGGKFHFTDKVYGHAQFGLSFSTQSGGGSAFTYAPSIGYDVSSNFDIAVKYEAATKNSSTVSFIGIRAGFSF